jgi:hypothetical protein
VLRRAEDLSIQFRYGLGFSAKGHLRLQIGLNFFNLGSMKERQFREIQLEQRSVPLQHLTIGERTCWYFQDRFYWENEGLQADDIGWLPRSSLTIG